MDESGIFSSSLNSCVFLDPPSKSSKIGKDLLSISSSSEPSTTTPNSHSNSFRDIGKMHRYSLPSSSATLLALLLLLLVGAATNVSAFAPSPLSSARAHAAATTTLTLLHSEAATAMADSGKPPSSSAASDMNIADDVEIPTKLPSDVGMDYVPLATMLATGQLAEADQVRHN